MKNAIRKMCQIFKNMEEEGCSSILQYFFFAHIGYVVEGTTVAAEDKLRRSAIMCCLYKEKDKEL